jgi:hypothetical protein
MKQFEKKYKCFEFIGPSPIDFDSHMLYNECVWEELCHFDLKTLLSKGKNKIGVIFNTDPHYKDGSHWISLFIHVKKGYIFYFDSNGNPVPKEIKVLVDRVIAQAKTMDISLVFDQNYPMEHQYSNTECGMYSLYFIIQLLRETQNILISTFKKGWAKTCITTFKKQPLRKVQVKQIGPKLVYQPLRKVQAKQVGPKLV